MPKASNSLPAATSLARPVAIPVAIVVSRYNATVTGKLLAGASAAYVDRAGGGGDLTVIPAPGAYELPVLAAAAAKSGRYRGVLALGCIIKGQTRHDEYIAHAVAQGLMNVGILTGVPCAFGVLTVEKAKQAIARAGGDEGNKGEDSMHALLDTIQEIDALAVLGSNTRSASSPRRTPVADKLMSRSGARGAKRETR